MSSIPSPGFPNPNQYWSQRGHKEFEFGVIAVDLATGRRSISKEFEVELDEGQPYLTLYYVAGNPRYRIDERHVSRAGWMAEGPEGLALLRPAPRPDWRRFWWRRSFADTEFEPETTVSELGGEPRWHWAVPQMLQRLAAPATNRLAPRPPIAITDHEQALGYWGALHYLLLYRLGWSRPELGLMWWFDQGKPLDDPTLALVADVWDQEGQLDVYLAWLLGANFTFLLPDAGEPTYQGRHPELSREWSIWRDKAMERFSKYPPQHFSADSGDSLHLLFHLNQSEAPDPSSKLAAIDNRKHRAIFVTGLMTGWYWDLERKTRHLPLDASPGWRVDVYVRTVGHLGTFRRSSLTGRWFTGRHSVHVAGAIDPQQPPVVTDPLAGTVSLADRHSFLRRLAKTGSSSEWAKLEKEWTDEAILRYREQRGR